MKRTTVPVAGAACTKAALTCTILDANNGIIVYVAYGHVELQSINSFVIHCVFC